MAEPMDMDGSRPTSATSVVGVATPAEYSSLSCFEVQKRLGSGQFSTVYRAKCIADGSIVAVKKVQVRGFWQAVK